MALCLYPDITSFLALMVNCPNDKIVSLYQPGGSKGHGLLHCALSGLSLLPEARHEHTSLTCGHETQAGVITEALPRSWLNWLQYWCWAQLIFALLPLLQQNSQREKINDWSNSVSCWQPISNCQHNCSKCAPYKPISLFKMTEVEIVPQLSATWWKIIKNFAPLF